MSTKNDWDYVYEKMEEMKKIVERRRGEDRCREVSEVEWKRIEKRRANNWKTEKGRR